MSFSEKIFSVSAGFAKIRGTNDVVFLCLTVTQMLPKVLTRSSFPEEAMYSSATETISLCVERAYRIPHTSFKFTELHFLEVTLTHWHAFDQDNFLETFFRHRCSIHIFPIDCDAKD